MTPGLSREMQRYLPRAGSIIVIKEDKERGQSFRASFFLPMFMV